MPWRAHTLLVLVRQCPSRRGFSQSLSMNILSETAVNYLSEGLNPIPLRNNKAPMLKQGHPYLYELVKEDDIEKLFEKAEKIGIVCGDVSKGFECIDFDGKDGQPIQQIFDQFRNDPAVKLILSRYALPIVKTPSGGYHIYYRHREKAQGSMHLASWKNGAVMIETRGTGGYVATIPSEGYTQIDGSDIVEVDTIESDERDALFSAAENLSQFTKTKSEKTGSGKWPEKFDTSTVWGRYNEEESTEAKDILTENGWEYIRTRKDGVEYWQRPGKDERMPVTGGTYGKCHNMFYCFTDSVRGFEQRTAYTNFDIFMIYKHHGDKQAAIKSLEKRYSQLKSEPVESDSFHKTDPISWFNWAKAEYAKQLLSENGWKVAPGDKDECWQQPGNGEEPIEATWKDNCFTISNQSISPFKQGCPYTPFQILVLLRFNGNFRSAQEWIMVKYFNDEVPYARIGTDYFKVIKKIDRYGIERTELKNWKKDEIKQDHPKNYLDRIPHFDDFTTCPNNINYTPVIHNCYNLYREFPHRPKEGEWKWSKILLQHIFGEQYEIGIRYMQILYLNPDRLMPILVLVSRERQTGKTTFVNWLNMIFGDNLSNIGPEDLVNGFNASYASANIIAVEETIVEKSITVEKLKALATTKFITVNQKFISQYRMPFFGKIVLTSNNEDKFARIDQEEIRFLVRKVGIPTIVNHNIEKDLLQEIPAFLHYLTTLPPPDFSIDRTGFTPKELSNDSLRRVKSQSRSAAYKEIRIELEYLFNNEAKKFNEFYVDADSIKNRVYPRNNAIERYYIRDVLKNEFKLALSEKPLYFRPFGVEQPKSARAFLIKREMFTNTPVENDPF